MSARFVSARERLSWAEEEIADLERVTRDFFTSKPYNPVAEPDDKGVYEIHKIKLVKPLPRMLSGRTIKTAEDLRAALDLVAYEIAEAANCASTKVHFPFCRSSGDIDSRLGSACKNFPKEITAFFKRLQPYEGGDGLLWSVNELCITSKHKLIVPVGTVVGPLEFSTLKVEGTGQFYMPWWNGEKNELTIARTLPGTKIEYNLQVTFNIAFGKIKVVEGQPVSPILHALLGKVSGIVDRTEAEAIRIGLFK